MKIFRAHPYVPLVAGKRVATIYVRPIGDFLESVCRIAEDYARIRDAEVEAWSTVWDEGGRVVSLDSRIVTVAP